MKFVAIIIAALALAGIAQAAPPPGLTEYGRTVWNLDALIFDTYGRRTTNLDPNARFGSSLCYRTFQTEPKVQVVSAFTVYCKDVALADIIPYHATFAKARKSAFRLLHIPNDLTRLYKKPTITNSQRKRIERALGNRGALIWFVYDEAEAYEAIVSCGGGRYLIEGRAGLECYQPY